MNEELAAVWLKNFSWFKFSGPDSARYLQGQISQDIRLLEKEPYIFSALLSNKGRIVSDLRVFRKGEEFYVAGNKERIAEIDERFMRYLIADEVEMTLLEDAEGLFFPQCVFSENVSADDVVFDFDLFGSRGKIMLLSKNELNKHKYININYLSVKRIKTLIPEWGAEITEKTLLQELSNDALWFSTNKGCYVGQEVVARIHSIGHVNKRLFLFSASSESPIQSGASLFFNGAEAGYLTSIAKDANEPVCYALGYLKRAHWERSKFLTTDEAVLTKLR